MDATNAGRQASGLNLQTLRRLKFWVWFQEWIRPTELQVTLIWAGIIGFAGAVCSIAYRVGTSFIHKILTGSSASGLVESFTELPLWGRLVVPAIGGLIAGAIIHFGSRFHGQVTTTDYMEAVVLGDGKISARRSLVKSSFCAFHQCLRRINRTRRSLGPTCRDGGVACRALAAVDDSAVAIARGMRRGCGNRFRLQCANCRRGVCRRDRARFHGDGNFRAARIRVGHRHAHGARLSRSAGRSIEIPLFRLNGNWEIIPYLLLGLGSGLVAPWFIRLLRASEKWAGQIVGAGLHQDVCRRLDRWRARCRSIRKCAATATASLTRSCGGQWLWQTLALILIFKVLATAATFGSGAVGGVFTPTLFVGASLGFLFGTATQHVTGSLR